MVVERFFEVWPKQSGKTARQREAVEAFVRSGANLRNSMVSPAEWTFPKFMVGYRVWAYGRPATIVGYVDNGEKTCGAHPGDYRYQVRFESTGETWTPWPYCESQLTSRE